MKYMVFHCKVSSAQTVDQWSGRTTQLMALARSNGGLTILSVTSVKSDKRPFLNVMSNRLEQGGCTLIPCVHNTMMIII